MHSSSNNLPANWPDLSQIRKGMTREEVVAVFGKPDDTGGASNEYTAPSIYVYGASGDSAKGVELWFEIQRDGKLAAAWNPETHEYVKGWEE